MKFKSWLGGMFVFGAILVASATTFANQAQDEAINYLKQATLNTSKAENLTYDINFVMNTPVAEGVATFQGKYSSPRLLSGDMNLAFNAWIVNMNYKMNAKYYSEVDNGGTYSHYFKFEATPPVENQGKWYVNKAALSEETLKMYAQERQKSAETVDKNIKNIFMYDVDKNTSKIYVTYHKPLVDNDVFKLASEYEDNVSEDGVVSLNKDKNFQAVLAKPRDIGYEVTIDKKANTIKEVNMDVSKLAQEVISEYLATIPDEKFNTSEGFNMKSVIKNYLARSKFTIDIKISDINKTTLDKVPQDVLANATDANELNKDTDKSEIAGSGTSGVSADVIK